METTYPTCVTRMRRWHQGHIWAKFRPPSLPAGSGAHLGLEIVASIALGWPPTSPVVVNLSGPLGLQIVRRIVFACPCGCGPSWAYRPRVSPPASHWVVSPQGPQIVRGIVLKCPPGPLELDRLRGYGGIPAGTWPGTSPMLWGPAGNSLPGEACPGDSWLEVERQPISPRRSPGAPWPINL